MLNLKPMLDAARAAEDQVKRIMAEMVDAFNLGTEEGKQKALDLRAELDAAQAEAKTANDLYVTVRDANAQAEDADDAARKFVPVSDAKPKDAKKIISRAEYEAMDHAARYQFFKDGGTLVDSLE